MGIENNQQSACAIYWFRNDLRLQDNPALCEAVKDHTKVLGVYILDSNCPAPYQMGGASKLWLHHALEALNQDLDGKLLVCKGVPEKILPQLVARYKAAKVCWNRLYEPWAISRDTQIKKNLTAQGVLVKTSNGSLLWEPWDVLKEDGSPYKVFTPFYRKGCFKAKPPRVPLKRPDSLRWLMPKSEDGVANWGLLDARPWAKHVMAHWKVGEASAHIALMHFLENGIDTYKQGRDFPAKPCSTSCLAPYLHFGHISPHQLWHKLKAQMDESNVGHFISEIAWREFSYYLLYHNPNLPEENLQRKFDAFVWQNNPTALQAWQTGCTGIPMVDAGMRQLWQTGYMHNRVRMIVASFLVKNLQIDWRLGAQWFWDCLLDADLASNSASWQWVAGCGADAAPYFRVFNPVVQGKKFDPDGDYVRLFIPELAQLETKYIFEPWKASEHVLELAGVCLGDTYPLPLVDLQASRKSALQAFADLSVLGSVKN